MLIQFYNSLREIAETLKDHGKRLRRLEVANPSGGSGAGTGDMKKDDYDPDNDGKVTAAEVADNASSVEWDNVANKPSSFPVSSHAATHDFGGGDEITELGSLNVGNPAAVAGFGEINASGRISSLSDDDWARTDITWSYVSSTQISVSGDHRKTYNSGAKIWLQQSGADKYFYLVGASYDPGSNVTTFTLNGGNNYSLSSAAVNNPMYSYSDNPLGFPVWFFYPVSFSSTTGDYSIIGRFKITERTCNVHIEMVANDQVQTLNPAISLPVVPSRHFSGTSTFVASNWASLTNYPITIGELLDYGRMITGGYLDMPAGSRLLVEISYEITPFYDDTPPTTPQFISGFSDTTDSITLSWTTSQDDTTSMPEYDLYFTNNTHILTTHNTSAVVGGLNRNTPYSFYVRAHDQFGNISPNSNTITVYTLQDAQEPTDPSNLQSSNIQETSFTVSWTASTDDVGVDGYNIFLDSELLEDTTSTSYDFSGLTANTSYEVGVQAFDGAGNTSNIVTLQVITLSEDTTPPSVPTNLVATVLSETSVRLQWSASTDDRGVSIYVIIRDGEPIGNTSHPNTSFTDTGLSTATTYEFQIEAVDLSGNYSGRTAPVEATTLGFIETVAPSNLTAVAISTSQINLQWDTASHPDGILAYHVYRDGQLLDDTQNTAYSDTGLKDDTSYSYFVVAESNSNVLSAESNHAGAKTDASGVLTGWFVSPSATASGNGTEGNPWTLEQALVTGGANGNTVSPGDRIYLMAGQYGVGADSLIVNVSGTALSRVYVRPYPGAHVHVRNRLLLNCEYVTFTNAEGCEFECGFTQDDWNATQGRYTPTSPGVTTGIADYAPGSSNGVQLINLIIHDYPAGVWYTRQNINSEIYGCLIYNNGYQTTTETGGGQGYGVYISNTDSQNTRKYVRNTIIGTNFGRGVYGASTTHSTNNMLFEDVVGFNTSFYFDSESGLEIVRNYLRGLDDVLNLTPKTEASDITVKDSTIMQFGDDSTIQPHWFGAYTNGEFTNITIYSKVSSILRYTSPSSNDKTWDFNDYYQASGTPMFDVFGQTPQTFSGWQSLTGFDTNSTASTGKPGTTKVFVIPNEYEPGRAHIVVLNWNDASTVYVDLSSMGYADGDTIVAHNALNYFEPTEIAELDYDSTDPAYSSNIPLSMLSANFSVARPVNADDATRATWVGDEWGKQASNPWPRFGVFVIRRKKQYAPPDTQYSDTFEIGDYLDDGYSNQGGGINPNSSSIYLGYVSEFRRGYFRFITSGMDNPTSIVSAHLAVYSTNTRTQTVDFTVYGDKSAASPSQISSSSDYDSRTRTTASVNKVVTQSTSGQMIADDAGGDGIDVTAIVQELVAGGFSDGNAMQFLFDVNSATNYHILSAATSTTPAAYPAKLHIVWTESGGGGGDTTAPTTPTNLSANAVSPSQINLAWSASSDNVGVTGYEIWRGGALVDTSVSNSYNDTGLSPSTSYTYQVRAYDAAGNKSGYSSSAQATTHATSDTEPPTAPTNLSASTVSSSQINLTWSASSDNVGVTGYRIYRNGSYITQVSGTSYNNTGLSPSTSYSYYVIAVDAAGNQSDQSNTASATTQPSSGGTQYYVATNGTTSGDGSISQPWTLTYAFGGAGGRVTAGVKVWIRGGTYNTTGYTCNLVGTSTNPIVFQNYPGEKVTITSSSRANNITFGVNARYVVLRGTHSDGGGFHLTHPDSISRIQSNSGALLVFTGKFCRAEGLVIYNGKRSSGIADQSAPEGTIIDGCIIYGNGTRDSADGAWRGSAIYNQNGETYSTRKYLRRNICFYSVTTLGKTGATNADVTHDVTWEMNTHFQQGTNHLFDIHSDSNTCRDIELLNNCYYTEFNDADTVTLGSYNYSGDSLNIKFNDNVLYGPSFSSSYYYRGSPLRMWRWRTIEMLRNTICNHNNMSWILPSGSRNWNINNNKYHYTNSSPFYIFPTSRPASPLNTYSLSQWRSTFGVDASSTSSTSFPSSPTVRIWQLPWDLDICYMTVFNWQRLSSVSIDPNDYVPGWLSNGQQMRWWDVQDFHNDPKTTLTYNGSPLSFTMNDTGHSVVSIVPAGSRVFGHTDRRFNCYILERL